jgi:hypothetical protein
MAEKKSAGGKLTKGLRLLIALGGRPDGAGDSRAAPISDKREDPGKECSEA